jgi:hypothetical protein
MLTVISKEIREINKQIKIFIRDETKIIVENEDGTENSIDPIPQLEERRHLLKVKFEQIKGGEAYQQPINEKIYDFYESFYREVDRNDTKVDWLTKYYHPSAQLTIIEGIVQHRFNTRESIVNSYLVKVLF